MREISYRESHEDAKKYREEYLSGIEKLINKRQNEAKRKREKYSENIFTDSDKYRDDLRHMLGWPLTENENKEAPEAEFELLTKENDVLIYRVVFKVLDDVELAGLIFKRENKKNPVVIIQHGRLGTPELVSNFYGKTYNYNNLTERVLEYDVDMFVPQLLIWSVENYGTEYNREIIDARLKSVGSSAAAVEIYGLMRVLDYFENKGNIKDFGMIGLSYGGFYTLYTAALDTRIKSAISCAFFNDRSRHTRSDWMWWNSGEMFGDAEVACLISPRRLCIEMGNADDVFDIELSKKEFARIEYLCKNYNLDWVEFKEFSGTHEFPKDDESIKRLVEDLYGDRK